MFVRLRFCLVLLLGFCSFSLLAQTINADAYAKYKFIKRNINKIENDSIALQPFYEALLQLEKKTSKRVSIVHIGDSHLQADFLSGAVRQKMQLRFGNAGRGFVFPFRAAKSNEPHSYRSLTNKQWDYKRNTFPNKPMPIGLGGFSIETDDTSAQVNLTVRDQPGLGYAFTKFTLFHEKSIHNFDITVCDENSCVMALYKASEQNANPYTSQLKFPKPVKQVIIQSHKTDNSAQQKTRIYGMLLENDSAGILYHMIGANGAEYQHYNTAKYFMQQLPYLRPNLVIISLGTNEAYYAGFNLSKFYSNIDTLVTNIKLANPNASIIITTPPDSFRKGRKGKIKNPDLKKARQAIINYCLQHNVAYWDLYEIMGGFGSMAKWYSVGLAAKDRVHFSAKGYLIQGDLFYLALMNGYEKYKKQHTH